MGSIIQAGISGGRDENGIITIVQPWHCDTLAECFTVGDRLLLGLPQVRRDFGTWDPELASAGYQIGITYQAPDPAGAEEDETFALQSDFSTESLSTHYNLTELMENWNGRIVSDGDEEKVVFGSTLPELDESQSRGFEGPPSPDQFKTNPFFGQKTYELYGGIWQHTYVRRTIPGNILSRVGSIIKNPPGRPPTPVGRDWAIQGPDITVFKNNTGVRITDNYKLSPPGGWPEGLGELIVT